MKKNQQSQKRLSKSNQSFRHRIWDGDPFNIILPVFSCYPDEYSPEHVPVDATNIGKDTIIGTKKNTTDVPLVEPGGKTGDTTDSFPGTYLLSH